MAFPHCVFAWSLVALRGHGVDQDVEEAVKLYEAAAHGDDVYANSAKCAGRGSRRAPSPSCRHPRESLTVKGVADATG